ESQLAPRVELVEQDGAGDVSRRAEHVPREIGGVEYEDRDEVAEPECRHGQERTANAQRGDADERREDGTGDGAGSETGEEVPVEGEQLSGGGRPDSEEPDVAQADLARPPGQDHQRHAEEGPDHTLREEKVDPHRW